MNPIFPCCIAYSWAYMDLNVTNNKEDGAREKDLKQLWTNVTMAALCYQTGKLAANRERERSLLRVGVEREIATSATIDKIVTFVHLNCGAGRSEMPIKHNPNRDKLLKQLHQLQLFCGHSFHIIKWSFAIFIRKSAARCATTFAEKPLLKPATITATTDIEANKQSW